MVSVAIAILLWWYLMSRKLWRRDRYSTDWDELAMLGIPLAFLYGALLVGVLVWVGNWGAQHGVVDRGVPIVALQDNSSLSGRFYIFSGHINGQMSFS